MAVMRMAHQDIGNNSGTTNKHLVKPVAVFHDFLGSKSADSSSVLSSKAVDVRPSEHSPVSAPVSIGASSVAAPCLFSTSDMGTERQVENHLEGLPFYGPRGDFHGAEIGNKAVGKRSNTVSSFMETCRENFTQLPADSLQKSHLMKIFRSATDVERYRRYNDDETFQRVKPLWPTPASPLSQPPIGSKTDAGLSKWEQPILWNASLAMPHPSHLAQNAPCQAVSDANAAGPSLISQLAADEGSRTGMKGPGILSPIKSTTTPSEKEGQTSTPPSGHELSSASRQMTIFYGGQAHVFDDVHPNKADVIMSLAGSNGGSWSTADSPKSSLKAAGKGNILSGENEIGVANEAAYPHEFQKRLSVAGDRLCNPSGSVIAEYVFLGAHLGSHHVAKDARTALQAAKPSSENKRGL